MQGTLRKRLTGSSEIFTELGFFTGYSFPDCAHPLLPANLLKVMNMRPTLRRPELAD